MPSLWIAVGGALGAVARYHVSRLAVARWGDRFPYGTLAINLLGSFLLSVLIYVAVTTGRIPDAVRLGLGVGVLGGFTTYSAFNFEVLALARAGHWRLAGLYVMATVIGGLIAGLLGWVAARAVVGG